MNILIIDTKSGAVEWEVPHGGGVSCSVFTPDGRTLITADGENNITFWNVATGLETMTIPQANPWPFRIMARDGNTLAVRAAASQEAIGVVELWHAPSLVEIDASERKRPKPPN